MRTCDDVRELIPWYVEGELSRDENVAVAEHVMECPECLREVAATIRVRSAVRDALLSEPRAADAMWERVEREVMGRRLAQLDVGSFLVGLRLGAWMTRRSVPVRADLRVLGREVALVRRKKEGGST